MRRAPIRILPSREVLCSLLSYDPDTGALIWKAREPITRADRGFNTAHAGKPAGSLSIGRPDGSNRYLVVGFRVDGKYQQVKAHRIVVKMMTGEEPPDCVDHHDGDELNLRWVNLRPATNGQNLHNAKLRSDNRSGVKGVCWDAWHSSWKAYISINKVQLKLGRFKRLEDAVKIVQEIRPELHGQFARAE